MKSIVRGIIRLFGSISKWAMEEESSIYEHAPRSASGAELHSIWDYLMFVGHSQAAHIAGVLGFDEWVSMDEIRRRISEIFSVEYKNDRSLYPYIKTLTDCGLLETSSAGGRRRWRKKGLFIKIEKSEKERREEAKKKAEAARKKAIEAEA